ncbi:MAG: amidohydrolase [Acidobacteria bacterium]|jgi:predicted amidohydrolase YtcJ|nr:amidohydrolase [Acidobacteriota bacterium]
MKRFIPLTILLSLFAFSVFGQKSPADLVLLNGKVFTGDSSNPAAEAIAIRDERILAVGSNDEIKKLANAKTRSIDLQGRIVTPGFNDAHFHFMPQPVGFQLKFTDLEPSWAEVVEAIKKAIKETPKGSWIFGAIGYRALADAEANRFALDPISPEHPIFLETYYGHGQIINSKAMPLLRISETQPDALGGYFERDATTKRINGRVFEYPQWRQNRTLAEMVSDEEAIRELKKMADEAIAFGITSLQIMPTMRIEKFIRLLEKADLPIRVRAIPFSLTNAKERDLSEIRALAKLKIANPKITASGIKWILDGTPFERGAALCKPYADVPDERGRLNFTESEIAKMLYESLTFRQPIMFHAVGDRTVEAVLTAMENIKTVDWRAKRVRIEHGEGVTPDLIARAKKLGVIVVQNPTHLALPEMLHARFSPDNKFSPVRSLIDDGIPFALGSDGPMNPFLNIMLAAIHPARPSEAISREQAVRAYTSGSAYSEFAENEKGVLRKGKLADLTVLSQDIFNAPVPELPKTQSVLTVVGGKIAYDAKVLK